jgi:hypothetical protein
MFSDTVGASARCVGDKNISLLGFFDINIIETDGIVGINLHRRSGVHDFFVDRIGQKRENGIVGLLF